VKLNEEKSKQDNMQNKQQQKQQKKQSQPQSQLQQNLQKQSQPQLQQSQSQPQPQLQQSQPQPQLKPQKPQQPPQVYPQRDKAVIDYDSMVNDEPQNKIPQQQQQNNSTDEKYKSHVDNFGVQWNVMPEFKKLTDFYMTHGLDATPPLELLGRKEGKSTSDKDSDSIPGLEDLAKLSRSGNVNVKDVEKLEQEILSKRKEGVEVRGSKVTSLRDDK